jgi:Domain of unknown function (DUF4386)
MQSANARPTTTPRLLALSGILFAVLFLIGWFASGALTPDYGAADEDWTNWADDNQWRSRISAFSMLLAGFVFLHFAATIRSALGAPESADRASPYLARVAFAGGVTGMAGMTMAIVMTAGATTEGADSNPVVSRAVMTASGGPFLLSAMGFAAFLLAAGLLTLRTGVFARWTGVVALIGAAGFLVAFATVLSGLGEDSVFGYGFFPGVLALVIWSIATSVALYRALGAPPS